VPAVVTSEEMFKLSLPPSTTYNLSDTSTSEQHHGTTRKSYRGNELELHVEQLRKKWLLKPANMVSDDARLLQLKTYHDSLLKKVSNLLTEKLSDEVR